MSKVIIVGGGVSGMSAGIFNLLNGNSVTIIEKHSEAGGNLTGWNRGEFHIDNCIHWLTGTNENTSLYKDWEAVGILGEGVKVRYPEQLFTYSFGMRKLELSRDLEKLRLDMLKISPLDEKEINSFISAVETVQGIDGTYGENHDQRLGIIKILFKAPKLYAYHLISTKELANRFVHPFLRKFFSCFLGNDFSALAFIVTVATFCGCNGGVPKGGSFAAAQRMKERFISLGGEMLCGKTAEKVIGGDLPKVKLCGGDELIGDYVILSCDVRISYSDLLNVDMPTPLKRAFNSQTYKRFSSVHCAFSTPLPTPFKGDYIVDVPSEYRKFLPCSYLVLREFSDEKSFAPSGSTVIEVMGFVGETYSREIISLYSDKLAYKSIKCEIARSAREIIVEKFPDLNGKLNLVDVWTPATYKRFTGAKSGEYMSFVMPPKYFPLRLPSKVKGVKNVIIASQWQYLPGGLPNALKAGKNAANVVAASERVKAKKFYGKLKFSR